MKHPHLVAVLAGLAFAAALAADASAMYHPTVGRFMQRDPIGYADGMSLYEYVGGRPVADRDPDGRETQKKCWCCCAIGVKFEGAERFVQDDTFGHKIRVTVTYEYIEIDKELENKDCTLKWEEKSNRVPEYMRRAGFRDNEWGDVNEEKPPGEKSLRPGSITLAPWHGRRKSPVGPGKPITVRLMDPAHIGKHDDRRVLYFAITVLSAPNCPCGAASLTGYATQTLDWPRGDWDFSRGVPAGELEGSYGY